MKFIVTLLTAGLMASSAFAADLPARKRHVEYVPVAPVAEPLRFDLGIVAVEPMPWAAKKNIFPFNPIPNVDFFGYRILGGWNR